MTGHASRITALMISSRITAVKSLRDVYLVAQSVEA